MGKTIQVFGFPYLLSAEAVKKFLENHTGNGTVYAVEVKQSKGGRRAFAIVQFANNKSAEFIIDLASKRLYYGTSYLKAWEMKTDIVQPRTYVQHMDGVTLNFGCLISDKKFAVLGSKGVSVKFGIGLKKIYFFLSHASADYKLQLSYENIWQVVLHRPYGQNAQFLLLQLFGAPRIYKRLEGSCYSFFKETPDDQWVRTTDFTTSWIGLSSSLCLEFRNGGRLPNFSESFFYYKESVSQVILQTGFTFSFSQNLALVPIVHLPEGVELPYKILFKISSLIQHGCFPGLALNFNFFQLVDPRRRNIACIEHALEKLYYLKECCYDPVRWLTEQYDEYLNRRQLPKSPSITLDDGLVYVRRVLVTPCKVYFCGPEVNVSNRVLRNYSEDIDNFLRVSFVDEEWEKIHSTDLLTRASSGNGIRTDIYERILSTLRNGFIIGDKRFEFLAFSSSQLRDNSVWMFASRPGLTANDIRTWMGDFQQIRNVAKYAARLGQSFGSSRETLSVGRHEAEVIPDVVCSLHGTNYIFSDGIGKISADFARRVAIKCGLQYTPSSFQIRYGGYKGVVAVDPYSSMKLSLRKSMLKYESNNIKLDVLGWSKYQPCYLNRQLVTLLSTLGVKDDVFEQKQNEAVEQLDAILHDSLKAQEALELMSPGENTNILKEMLNCGYMPDAEPFLSMMLQTFRASKLLDLRTRSRIFIPNGRAMMGCLDESRTLEYGQVFVQFTGTGRRQFYEESHPFNDSGSTNCNFILEGNVVVAKNPCLHPGDIRVLRAVDVPALHHMVDCVVFPQKGKRPHPNECSGSDLDGDIYFVCWDPDLIPPRQVQPMDYTPAPSTQLDHDVTIEEVQEYFTNYIVNDSLGIIANAHVVFADREPDMAMSDPCKQLAQLFSIAVDFPKTGVPAEIPSQLRPKEYPDFMEKPDKPTYHSEKVIGKLFQKVKDKTPQASSIATFTMDVARKSYDGDMIVNGFEDYIDEAFYYKSEYDNKLGNLMDYYGVKTEAEILSGGIMKASKTFDRRKDAEAIGIAVRSLRKEARTWFKKRSDIDDMLAKASAWYHVTYHHTYWGLYNEGLKRDHFISFPWCVYDQLIQIKKAKARKKPVLHLSSLGNQLSRKLVLI
ncbi:probable RNA-dependent RNA polymerase 1 [Nicotiana sylvestris]|uniref:RNA-dependent RNA polymerase n=1 Tax=Nicotiana sylvestris TaxID=4096 RepID=A0A1U7X2K5_NICSY|nr:PREDICTED: probable RNA-dependent RNA polymerase 1 [Nicotiana sylvestris]XP_009781108.1 PREDICTED: probable RNA-dependent RNA polymerase 1 [Nicotiana sylvestris]XP_009781109.1 PREDICTED: probable RNA-dependent RNA polymerase 1 [Nicotiana sylvestris]